MVVIDHETITLNDLGQRLLRNKYSVFGSLLLGVVAGLLISFSLRPTYRAQIVVMPVSANQGSGLLSGLLNQVGGLASLAGLGATNGDSREAEYLAVLKSRDLAEKFLLTEQLLRVVTKSSFRFGASQSEKEPWTESDTSRAVKRFQNRILTISEDRRAGTITVAVTWFEAKQASSWANKYIGLANAELRARALNDSERVLKYLNTAVEKESSVELRQTLYKLIEGQLNSISLAQAKPEYAFRVIDPAFDPDPQRPDGPNRILFVGGGGLLGGFIYLASSIARQRRGSSLHR
jgi:uncharacterized protein involved in exopolysaccharide biosynthesis